MQIEKSQVQINGKTCECKLETNIGNIYCRLASKESFKGCLGVMPHEELLDMVILYYVYIRLGATESVSLMINNKLMESWGISKKQLRETAWSNTVRDNPPILKRLRQVLIELGVVPEKNEPDVYMISNDKKYFGAVCMAYPGFPEKVSACLNGDFYLLPSSVHECLAIPCNTGYSVKDLRKMVKSINRTELPQKDILSDSVYRYSAARQCLVIDNS